MNTEILAGQAEAFDLLDETLRTQGASAVVDRLVTEMEARDDPRGLLDALLLRARHDLGLASVQPVSLTEIPEPERTQYEERYVEAIRHVGRKLLAEGSIARAWPYYRAIGEKDAIVAALDAYQPEPGESPEDLIDVAFNQAAHPVRGYEWILQYHGICSAITAFDSLPPEDATRVTCAGRLVKSLHAQLTANLRADIARRGQPMLPERATIAQLLEGRPWLFDDDGYHIDVSHLASIVRLAPMLSDPELIAKAIELTDYGRNLPDRYQYEGEPPFEDLHADHGRYLGAMIGRDVEAAIAHFREKLPPSDPDGSGDTVPAQVLIRLLVHLKRFDDAIGISVDHLANVPEASLGVPGLSQLCERAGRRDRLAEVARSQGDLVRYIAAILPKG